MMTEPVRLGDVLELVREPVDIDPTEKYERLGLYSFGKGVIHHPSVPGTDVGKLRFYRVRADELVLSNQMAWEGAIAVTTTDDEHLIASNRFLTYSPREEETIDVSYLRYLLLSGVGMEIVRQGSPGSTIRNRTLSIKTFEAIEVPLPPFDRQQSIAAELEETERSVSKLSKRIEQSQELCTKALNALVHRADLDDGQRVRSGWKPYRVGEFLSLDLDEVKIHDGETYPMTGVYSFGRGLFAKDHVVGGETSYTKYYRLRESQIVLSRLFGWEGAIALVTDEFDGRFVSTEFPTFSVNEDLAVPEFVAALFGTEAFWGQLRSEAEGMGVRRQRIYAEQFLEQEVWLPPPAYQRAVSPKLARLHDIVNENRREELLEVVMPSLLNATFTDLAT